MTVEISGLLDFSDAVQIWRLARVATSPDELLEAEAAAFAEMSILKATPLDSVTRIAEGDDDDALLPALGIIDKPVMVTVSISSMSGVADKAGEALEPEVDDPGLLTDDDDVADPGRLEGVLLLLEVATDRESLPLTLIASLLRRAETEATVERGVFIDADDGLAVAAERTAKAVAAPPDTEEEEEEEEEPALLLDMLLTNKPYEL